MPSRIEHLPPEFLRYLLTIERFDNSHQVESKHLQMINVKENVIFNQAISTSDVYALGIILLQIATGYPAQMELPIKIKCQTINNQEAYLTTPHFGQYQGGINKKHIGLTVKHQERIGRYTESILKKCEDPYGLLGDADFFSLLSKIIAADYQLRPTVKEILQSNFMQKWVDSN